MFRLALPFTDSYVRPKTALEGGVRIHTTMLQRSANGSDSMSQLQTLIRCNRICIAIVPIALTWALFVPKAAMAELKAGAYSQ